MYGCMGECVPWYHLTLMYVGTWVSGFYGTICSNGYVGVLVSGIHEITCTPLYVMVWEGGIHDIFFTPVYTRIICVCERVGSIVSPVNTCMWVSGSHIIICTSVYVSVWVSEIHDIICTIAWVCG